jgi:hypothetical protein
MKSPILFLGKNIKQDEIMSAVFVLVLMIKHEVKAVRVVKKCSTFAGALNLLVHFQDTHVCVGARFNW